MMEASNDTSSFTKEFYLHHTLFFSGKQTLHCTAVIDHREQNLCATLLTKRENGNYCGFTQFKTK